MSNGVKGVVTGKNRLVGYVEIELSRRKMKGKIFFIEGNWENCRLSLRMDIPEIWGCLGIKLASLHSRSRNIINIDKQIFLDDLYMVSVDCDNNLS